MLTYNHAAKSEANGEYGEAAEAFAALGDYKDADDRAVAATYKYAESLFDGGDYDGALTQFKSIGGYKDANARADACSYQKAVALGDEGNYEGAIALLEGLDDYPGASDKIAEYSALLIDVGNTYDPYSEIPLLDTGGLPDKLLGIGKKALIIICIVGACLAFGCGVLLALRRNRQA
jgi:tetratricopeptide (TPR) repeat protein